MLSLLSNFLEPYDSNQSAASLTLHENDAVHVQLTSGTSSSNREEERPPEPIPGFGSRAGTTNCDASSLGGFVRRYLSTWNLRITSNFFRCTTYAYLVSHSVLCHCSCQTTLTKRQKKKKKKKKIVRCQCTTKLTQVSSFSESHTCHADSQSSAASNSGLIRIGTQPRTADAWHHDSCRPRGVLTRDFRPFLTVCLTVFPFEFRPRTFTIGFYGKKSFISELMILECSFPLIEFLAARELACSEENCPSTVFDLLLKFCMHSSSRRRRRAVAWQLANSLWNWPTKQQRASSACMTKKMVDHE